MKTSRGRLTFERLIGISSFIAPFVLGMIFTAMVKGMPIDQNGDIKAGFFDYVNLYSIVGGVAVALIAYIHGLNFTRLKVTGEMRNRALAQLKWLYPVLLGGEVVFAVLSYFYTDFIQIKPVLSILILGLIVVFTLLSWFFASQKREGFAFILSGLILVGVVIFLFVGLFPRVMVANNHAFDILAQNASSSPYTLRVMTIVTITALPITLAYQIWSFIVFRRRVTAK
jgi:cytochrome d ubiquinol oxidase subunit II